MFRILVRMARWVRRPPSLAHVLIAAGVVALAALLYAVENTVGWPEALTIEPPPRHLRQPVTLPGS